MSESAGTETDAYSAYQRAEQVKEQYQAEILRKANVVGLGVGLRSIGGTLTDEVSIVVMVTRKIAKADLAIEDLLPTEIEGIPIDVQEVGSISPHA